MPTSMGWLLGTPQRDMTPEAAALALRGALGIRKTGRGF
jgi:hypothetical protein